jgi:hypothetical protein
VALLRRAEHAAFGRDGCGIDWRAPAAETAPEQPDARSDVFRGDVCNCQARIGRDARGRTRTLGFSSTC